MQLYQKIYEFAASAGAFEGYVYRRPESEIDMQALSNWVNNLYDAYRQFSPDILDEFQSSLDRTLGRAFQSLVLQLDHSHAIFKKLKQMIKGELPITPDDFQKRKWFQE